MELSQRIRDGWRARAELERDPDVDCYRLFHGWSEGCPGLEIDRYGDAVVIAHGPELAPRLGELVETLDQCRRFEVVVARGRGAEPIALRGAPPAGPTWLVREHGLRFAVDLMRAGNPGLYLDARPARQWIRRNAAGRRVLNLFAFTGSLGVAAAAGGARPVAHVDSHRGALDWCRENARLNGVEVDERDLARMNIYQHIRRAQAGRQRYGAIILDAPPGPERPRAKDRTPGLRGTLALAPLAARMLEPGGWLLCFFHRDARDPARLEAEMAAAAGVRLEPLWRGASGPDFPGPDPRGDLTLIAMTCAGGDGGRPASRDATGRGSTPPPGPPS
ncbi:MAG TPA: class I SAM-dependent methyltransferase [Kofleriaceae bacterium]|nr:class I SAM-dependent methyltransferase [Kofleriaceae bacterium]